MKLSRIFAFAFVSAIGAGGYAGWMRWTRERIDAAASSDERKLEARLQRAGPQAPAFVRPRPMLHERMGELEIPRVHITVDVVEGADDGGLKRGAGHIVGTGYPGDFANVGIAAHRDSYFRPLSKIQRGDAILLRTEAGLYRYEVSGTEIVTPQDVSVLRSDGRAEMTLVTCYPFYYVGHAPKRFIVHATLTTRLPAGSRG